MRIKLRRRILKGAGLVGCLLVGVAFARSLRHVDQWLAPEDRFVLGTELGAFFFVWEPNIFHYPGAEPIRGYSSSLLRDALIWRPRLEFARFSLVLPLWIPFVLLAIPTLVLWHRDRRCSPTGHCQRCGYDLTGNVSGRCPECGQGIRAQHVG